MGNLIFWGIVLLGLAIVVSFAMGVGVAGMVVLHDALKNWKK